jgi:SAM-dependent methyltransferase
MKLIEVIIYLFFLILTILILSSMVRAYISAAPWCPTRKKDWDRIIKVAGIKNGELMYDFGSGTACVASYISKKTGAAVIGFELSWAFYLWSIIRNFLVGNKNVKIKHKNFFKQDVADADYIFCFLTPRAMKKLGEKFKKELSSKTKIISYAFKIPDWEPWVVDREGGSGTPIYVYMNSKYEARNTKSETNSKY